MSDILDELGLSAPVPEPTLATATLEDATADVAHFRLADGTRGLLPRSEFFPNRTWRRGERYVVCVLERSPRTRLSTAHPEMLRLLLESHVPEVRDGRVRVMAAAREVGIRAKVAVAPTVAGVDAVAACVGRASNRVRALSEALGGERVDIVAWHPDADVFVANALGPVGVSSVRKEDGALVATVAPHNLDAAVGGGGLNAALAAALCGVRLSVRAEGDTSAPDAVLDAAADATPDATPDVGPVAAPDPSEPEV